MRHEAILARVVDRVYSAWEKREHDTYVVWIIDLNCDYSQYLLPALLEPLQITEIERAASAKADPIAIFEMNRLGSARDIQGADPELGAALFREPDGDGIPVVLVADGEFALEYVAHPIRTVEPS